MGILEKLRSVPRWKHADPAVRAAAVYEIGADDSDALRTLAREDAEARVRRAAVTRLDDIALLGDIARTDPDDDVKAEAVRVLAGLGAEASAPATALDVVSHLAAAGRTREIVVVVRENASPDVRRAIIERVDDPKSLGSISRHGADSATRLQALARLADADELLNVALKAVHTDVSVAALERIADVEALTAIGQRARSKVASRRARTKLRQIEDAARPVIEKPAAMSAEERTHMLTLLHRTEGLVAIADPGEAAAALAEVRLAWAELQADVSHPDDALAQQFDNASDAVREAIAERQQERAAEEERLRAVLREQADRITIVDEIERLEGASAPDRIAELRVAWDALPPMPSEYAASLTRRFQDASRAFEDRERRRVLAAAAAGRLETLATELEQLLASEQPVEEIVARWRGLRRDADVLREFVSANPQAGDRLERAVTALEAREQEHQQLRAKLEQDNLRRLQQLCRQIETLVTAGSSIAESSTGGSLTGTALTLKAGDRALRDIKAALDERAPLPSKKDRQEIHARLEAARAAIGPRVQELRAADEWQRWANLQVQEELCKEMEALKGEQQLDPVSLNKASRRMRELQARWKHVALAPRAQGETMWRRFKTAQDEVYGRTAAHVVAQNAERGANLTRKDALCTQAEALAESTDWVRTAAAIQALQAEWKTIGPVARGHERAIWERFRAACDRFFTRRQDDLKRRKDEWSTNLSRKDALCAAAEALSESIEWESAAAKAKQLQAEWKTIGPVRKAKSEVIWQQFRGACDRFFERYKHRDQLDLLEKAQARQAIIGELEALLPPPDATVPVPAPEHLPATMQQARTRWQQAPQLPPGMQQDLAAKYHEVLGKLVALWPDAFAGTEMDPAQTRKRMEKLVARVEELVPSQPVQRLSPAELLAKQWRERLAVNTMAGAGKAVESEESRWRAAEQEIRNAQAQWMRMGPVPADIAGPLNERFQRACRRFFDQRRKVS